jgi:hypothetical protein
VERKTLKNFLGLTPGPTISSSYQRPRAAAGVLGNRQAAELWRHCGRIEAGKPWSFLPELLSKTGGADDPRAAAEPPPAARVDSGGGDGDGKPAPPDVLESNRVRCISGALLQSRADCRSFRAASRGGSCAYYQNSLRPLALFPRYVRDLFRAEPMYRRSRVLHLPRRSRRKETGRMERFLPDWPSAMPMRCSR